MTETEMKLRDAKVQLVLAQKNIDDEAIVQSCVNAFVSLARSVTFVMQSESGSDTPLALWYRTQMDGLGQIPLLKFFNDRRVYSIHKGTVTLRKTAFSVFGTQRSAEGNVIFSPQTATGWLFENTSQFNLPSSASAIWLCHEYVKVLEKLVLEWSHRRLVT